jgi:hypothetical protein
MPSKSVAFKHTDTARLMKAVTSAGLKVKAVTMKNGQPYLEIEQGNAAADDGKNPWDAKAAADEKRPA